jgi:threonyl-tRNA synthetase
MRKVKALCEIDLEDSEISFLFENFLESRLKTINRFFHVTISKSQIHQININNIFESLSAKGIIYQEPEQVGGFRLTKLGVQILDRLDRNKIIETILS